MYATLTLCALALIWCARSETQRGRVWSSLLLTSVTAPWLIAFVECLIQERAILSVERPVSLWVMLSSQSRVELLSDLYWVDAASMMSAIIALILIIRASGRSHQTATSQTATNQTETSQTETRRGRVLGLLLKLALFTAPITHLVCWELRLSRGSLDVFGQGVGLSAMSVLTWIWISRRDREERARDARLIALIWLSAIASVSFGGSSRDLLEISEALRSSIVLLTQSLPQLDSLPWSSAVDVFAMSLITSLLICAPHFRSEARPQGSKWVEGALLVGLSVCAATPIYYQIQRFSQHREALESVWEHAAPLSQTDVTLPTASSGQRLQPASTLLLKGLSMWVDGRAVDEGERDIRALLATLKVTRAEQIEALKQLKESGDFGHYELVALDAIYSSFVIGASRETPFWRVHGAMKLAQSMDYRDFQLMVRAPSGARRFIPTHLPGTQPRDFSMREERSKDSPLVDALDAMYIVRLIKPEIQVNMTQRGYEIAIVLDDPDAHCHSTPVMRVDQEIPCRGACDQPESWDHQALRRALAELKAQDPSDEWLNLSVQSDISWESVIATLDACREVTVERRKGESEPRFMVALSVYLTNRISPEFDKLLNQLEDTPDTKPNTKPTSEPVDTE